MRPALRRDAAIAVLAALVLVGGAALLAFGGAAASPQPITLCDVCGDAAFEEAGGERSATVSFAADGTAEWHVDVGITNATLAEQWRERPPPVGDPGTAVAVTDDDRLVVTNAESGAARPGAAGTLLTEAFHTEAPYVTANLHEFTVVAPDGYHVARAPSGASVDGDRATWTFDDPHIDEGYGPQFDDGRIAFAPEDAAAPSARGLAAVGAATFAPVVAGIHPFSWAAFYAGVAATLAVAHYGRRPDDRLRPAPLLAVALVTAAVPVLVLVGFASGGGSGGLPGPFATVVTGTGTAVLGLVAGVVGLVGYAVAARSPAKGP